MCWPIAVKTCTLDVAAGRPLLQRAKQQHTKLTQPFQNRTEHTSGRKRVAAHSGAPLPSVHRTRSTNYTAASCLPQGPRQSTGDGWAPRQQQPAAAQAASLQVIYTVSDTGTSLCYTPEHAACTARSLPQHIVGVWGPASLGLCLDLGCHAAGLALGVDGCGHGVLHLLACRHGKAAADCLAGADGDAGRAAV